MNAREVILVARSWIPERGKEEGNKNADDHRLGGKNILIDRYLDIDPQRACRGTGKEGKRRISAASASSTITYAGIREQAQQKKKKKLLEVKYEAQRYLQPVSMLDAGTEKRRRREKEGVTHTPRWRATAQFRARGGGEKEDLDTPTRT